MTSNNATLTSSDPVTSAMAKQAIELSSDWIESYESDHGSQSAEDRGLIAESRLEFLLVAARADLSRYFTAKELQHLLGCFTGEMLEPAVIDEMADAVLEHDPEATGLAQKVQYLGRLQKVALADLLEQMYYQSPSLDLQTLVTAKKLGVAVK